MKAYLDFQGFTRMVDIPRPMPEILIPIIEKVDICANPWDKPSMTALKFYSNGELSGGDEIILRYRWDGVLPRGDK